LAIILCCSIVSADSRLYSGGMRSIGVGSGKLWTKFKPSGKTDDNTGSLHKLLIKGGAVKKPKVKYLLFHDVFIT